MPRLVFLDCWLLAALLPVEELLDQRLDEVVLPDGVLGELAGSTGVDERLLEDMRGVEPALEPAVQME
jgi:hypothetical protein